MNELITVVVPIYNVSKYLRQCIDSIINQTYTNLEIILIDDGSTDNCLDIIKEYSKKDNRIKYHTRDNRGLLYTRIEGVKEAKGSYITFVDSDDWLEENAIEVMYRKIIQYSADMLKSSYRIIAPNKNKDVFRKTNDEIYEGKYLNKIYDELVSNYIFHTVWSQLIKSEIIKQYIDKCDYTISMGEDVEINIHLLDKYKKIVVTNDILYNYRFNINSISHTTSYEKTNSRVNDLIKTYKNFCDFINKNKKENYEKALEKSMKEISDHLLDFANIKNLKYKKIVNYIKEVFSDNFIETIRKNSSYKNINDKSLKNRMFIKNMYYKNYRKYIFNLLILNKYIRLKNIIKKVIGRK